MVNYEPVIYSPDRYIQGLNLSFAGNQSLNLSPGQTRDRTNQFDLILSDPITLNGAITGVNGLMPGSTLSASTFYNIYVIGSSTGFAATAAMIAPIGQTIILPYGYDLFNDIGIWNTNGTSNFFNIYQIGNSTIRTYFYDPSPLVLNSGSADTFTSINLSAFIPTIRNVEAILNSFYVPIGASNTLTYRPTGSSSNGTIVINALVVAVGQNNIIKLPALLSSTPSIDYKVTGHDLLDLFVYGFSYGL
jgi:hypothetical protein